MAQTECDRFQSVMSALVSSGGPINLEDDLVKHLRSCESCDDWMEEQVDDEVYERLGPLVEKLEALEDQPSDDD